MDEIVIDSKFLSPHEIPITYLTVAADAELNLDLLGWLVGDRDHTFEFDHNYFDRGFLHHEFFSLLRHIHEFSQNYTTFTVVADIRLH